MADVKVPVLGTQPKKHVAIIGGVVIAVVGVGYYRSKKATAAAAATAAPTTAQIDPATGFTYGSPQDAAALAQQASYVAPGGAGYSGGGGGGGSSSSGPTTITDNNSWTEAGQQYLVGVVGLDAATVSAALGAYITGTDVTLDQKSIIQQAIAAVGFPPTAGTSGYPPAIHEVASTPTTKTQLAAPVISSNTPGRNPVVTITWPAVAGATGYQVQGNKGQNARTTGTSAQVNRPGTYWVIATAPNAYSSPASNVINV